MAVRRAHPSDLAAVLDLAERRRADYAIHQPRFWRPADDARRRQSEFFASLLLDPQVAIMVSGDSTDETSAFVIARLVAAPPVYDPGGLTCVIDDFAVRDPSAWPRTGGALIDAVRTWAAEHGAVQLVVVTGAHDDPKRAALKLAGLSLASEWWVGELEP